MHMADALLSPQVGVSMCLVSVAAAAYSVKEIKSDELLEKKIPVMGVMGAFVFAAQMINFTIPATGSSGHIGGGLLLAAMIGGCPALLSMTAVLLIQALFFADGGLLALGCNIFNMGVIPCLIVYPLIFKPLLRKGITSKWITLASIIAVVVGLQLGSLCVVLQTQLSHITKLPFSTFALLMQPIHLAIGLAEGLITAAVLCFVHKARPEILEGALNKSAIKSGTSIRNTLAALALIALITGGVLSLFASEYPDGLEWAIEKTAGQAELEADAPLINSAASLQEATAFMPDYGFKNESENQAGTAVAGIVGGALTFVLSGASALAISAAKKKKKDAV